MQNLHHLLLQAEQAAARAYAPYSKFRVGAAVLAGGRIFTGVNVENASYGLTLCAERSALSAWIAAGGREGVGDVKAIAVCCLDADGKKGGTGCMPCGACRQWLVELAPDALLVASGLERPVTVRELLPLAFRFGRSKEFPG